MRTIPNRTGTGLSAPGLAWILLKNFFLFDLLDVGTGDSDLTWQALGGVGYRFEWFNLIAAYRYMNWDFGDDVKVLDDMDIHGPAVGIQFTF